MQRRSERKTLRKVWVLLDCKPIVFVSLVQFVHRVNGILSVANIASDTRMKQNDVTSWNFIQMQLENDLCVYEEVVIISLPPVWFSSNEHSVTRETSRHHSTSSGQLGTVHGHSV